MITFKPGEVITVIPYKDTAHAYPSELVTFKRTYEHSDLPGEEFVATNSDGVDIAYRYKDIERV